MIYPENFEEKIGFDEIKRMLKEQCVSKMGCEKVDELTFSDQYDIVSERLQQVQEFTALRQDGAEPFTLQTFFDVRPCVQRLRLEGTHLEEEELFDLLRSLIAVAAIAKKVRATEEDTPEEEDDEDAVVRFCYPALAAMAEGVASFAVPVQRIERILDKYGRIKDSASQQLYGIRRELEKTANSISHTLYSILRSAQSEGLVDKDVTPAMRDGRLVIPVVPAMKKKVKGIVHDESATGKTVFIEPVQVVEANNRVRELEAEERREIIRILTEVSQDIRPYVEDMMHACHFLAMIDMTQARAVVAEAIGGISPSLDDAPLMDWIQARHPLLQVALAKQGKQAVPLDIALDDKQRILIISGPNAGGKSVCLKTVGLLQYMLQCGMPIPVSERSHAGIFEDIMIDIGDQQSISDDLSTYSGHLLNMKNMMKKAGNSTLLLIDEFGGGTEPMIGAAIAQSVLAQFCKKQAFGVITTHYQNLKHYADEHDGIINGAMLYDRHEMRPLFQLAIGRPGSSFAIEIARKTGLPEEVIAEATSIVGTDYIQSDKYLQDIVRDKRYWEGKRQNIRKHEKSLEEQAARYEQDIEELQKSRKAILQKAQQQAKELLEESNRRIENVIREIRESQAEKEETRRMREELKEFKQEVLQIDTKAQDELIEKKMRQILERRQRKEQRKKEGAQKAVVASAKSSEPKVHASKGEVVCGSYARIKGVNTVGRVEQIQGGEAVLVAGDVRTRVKLKMLEPADAPRKEKQSITYVSTYSRMTRDTIDNRKLNFKQDLDVRGMRGEEAVSVVARFIDDATLVGMSRVRILHGTGTGVLRQLIRQYLNTVPNVVECRDEHVQFGGAGITVVDME
ncbi:MAG: endonuclease MutS2 [Prevotella sp.]